jgi:hypothetical protein
MAMSETDRISDGTADDFGVKPVIPFREVDLARIIRRLEPLLEDGIHFLPECNLPSCYMKHKVFVGTLIKPFALKIFGGCINICSVALDTIYSVEIEYEDDCMSTQTLYLVVAILSSNGYTYFDIM